MFLFWGGIEGGKGRPCSGMHLFLETDVLGKAINLLNPVSPFLNKMSPRLKKGSPSRSSDFLTEVRRTWDVFHQSARRSGCHVWQCYQFFLIFFLFFFLFGDLIWNYLENVMEGKKNETGQELCVKRMDKEGAFSFLSRGR